MFEIGYLHKLIRDIPKPVIAAVNGVAVGGGHVLHVLCDLSIAAETARFGQAGPKVGSFDAGFGSAYLARVVGEKQAREMWYLCRLYDAATAERWGLVNAVVPADRLMDEAKAWAAEIGEKSPTAIALPQAVVQRRHRPPGGPVQPGDVRARPVHRVAGGAGGRHGVRREAAAGLQQRTSWGTRAEGDGQGLHALPFDEVQESSARSRAVRGEAGARTTSPTTRPPSRDRPRGRHGGHGPDRPAHPGVAVASAARARPPSSRDRGRGDRARTSTSPTSGGRARWSGHHRRNATDDPEVPRTGCPGSASVRRSSGIGITEPGHGTDAAMPRVAGPPRRGRLGAQRQKTSFGLEPPRWSSSLARTGGPGQGHQCLPGVAGPARASPASSTGPRDEGRASAGWPTLRRTCASPATTCSASEGDGFDSGHAGLRLQPRAHRPAVPGARAADRRRDLVSRLAP